MTSPYSSGGGGTHLEARVAASCLAAVLCEGAIRGLPGEFATQVRTQRAAFGDPLDDIVVDGIRGDGRITKLYLQVKNKITFTTKDEEWTDVLQRSWEAFAKPEFDPTLHRVGVGIGAYNARADQHYQTVLGWAEHSADARHFFERIAERDYSHEDKRSFVETIKAVLEAHAGRTLAEDELWRFLKAFVIVHYDFQTTASSRDEAAVIDRLRNLLSQEQRSEADRIWDNLVAKAGELIPAGGGATNETLSAQLIAAGFAVGPAQSYLKDIQALHQESLRGLADIRSHIHGLKLHRAEAYQKAREALSTARFIQIDGEPGTGKSALLKDIAEECARTGPVVVLKDSRIHPRGWAAHAHVLGVSPDLTSLLREFGCAGAPILFIDGIDKITDPAVQLTVNDVLKAIANEDRLAQWRVLVTIREQNLRHLETWLDPDALKKLPIQTIRVEPLDDAERHVVAKHFPRLGALLAQGGGADVILKRPFFLNAMIDLGGGRADSQLPATEVELLNLWWEMGGSDRSKFSQAQHRRNLIVQAGEAIARAPGAPIAVRPLTPETLAELKEAGVFRDKEFGHSVMFAHDIYEEWALCEYLIGKQPDIPQLLRQVGEPDALIRPVQLLGTYALEVEATTDSWKKLFEGTGSADLRPVWQRAVLTSSVQSTRTVQLLEKITDYLLERDAAQLRKLMLAIQTVEVLPNPIFLNEKQTPDIGPEDRARYAYMTAVPKPLTWVRFLDWLMPQMAKLPPSIIPDAVPMFKTWQDAFAGKRIRHCREIGALSAGWLTALETAGAPKSKNSPPPFGGALSGKGVGKSVRALFLASAGDVPKHAAKYLHSVVVDRERARALRSHILKNSSALIKHVPTDFVDFFLAAFLESPEKQRRDPFGSYSDYVYEHLGVASDQEFYPASPLQSPFLHLLRAHEDQGLRLIRNLCNHSIGIWRKAREGGRAHSEPATPLPIDLIFPWGPQTFWGNRQVYLWFRGMWGNDAVESALMALEQWALEKLEGGATFEDVFRKTIEGHESVAALGIGVSLCLAREGAGLECAFPLVTCTHLWGWDIERLVSEMSPTNEMGNWHKDEVYLKAVRALNKKPHRKLDIRRLVPYFVFSGDEALIERFAASVRGFPDRLPLSYDEENANADNLAALREQMVLYSEQGDPQHWKTAPTPDGKGIQFWNDPPSLQKPERKEQQQRHAQFNEHSAVAMWAHKCLEQGRVADGYSIETAIGKARGWDRPDLFDTRIDSFEERQCAGAVAGAASVAARFSAPEVWTEELSAWCLDVLERAATGAETPGDFTIRHTALLMHPAVFAAHGYSGLIARGCEEGRSQTALLNLATDALRDVQTAVLVSAKCYASTQPVFYWVLLDVILQQCVAARDELPSSMSVVWDEQEAVRMIALIDRAEGFLRGNSTPEFPAVPLPWIKGEEEGPRGLKDTKGYKRNERMFVWQNVAKVLPHVELDAILINPARRTQLLKLLRGMLEYTFQEVLPPFADSRRERHGHTPYELISTLSAWCGKLCTRLSHVEARGIILSPIWAQDSEVSFRIMHGLMRSFMIDGLLKPSAISQEHVALWNEIVGWLFASPEWTSHGDHLDNDFTYCAVNSLFCAAGDFSPVICGIDPGWPHLNKFLPTIERAVREFGTHATLYQAVITFLKRGGIDLLPEPALGWLHGLVAKRKGDRKFWQVNGEDTVDLVKQVIAQKGSSLTEPHRKMIMVIADILIDDGVRGAGFLQQELLRSA